MTMSFVNDNDGFGQHYYRRISVTYILLNLPPCSPHSWHSWFLFLVLNFVLNIPALASLS